VDKTALLMMKPPSPSVKFAAEMWVTQLLQLEFQLRYSYFRSISESQNR